MTSVAAYHSNSLLPNWIPKAARRYLIHTEKGISLRDLARSEGCHASTVLRQVRRFENRRDDPLVDEALRRLSIDLNSQHQANTEQGQHIMTAHLRNHSEIKVNANTAIEGSKQSLVEDEEKLGREARRVLRRMSETGAVLALAGDMDKAVVLRSLKDGPPTRTAVVTRDVAQAFALKNWIVCSRNGRVASYTISSAGRSALKKYLAEDMERKRRSRIIQDDNYPFRDASSNCSNGEMFHNRRPTSSESPLAMLARRRDKDGRAFIASELVQAGERFREDYELSQMGQGATQCWDRFMATGDRSELAGDSDIPESSKAARERILAALDDLGPGLGDIIMRCCCFLEGLETAEKRMGWSARSGKVVLRIALQRLHRHYVEATGHISAMIG